MKRLDQLMKFTQSIICKNVYFVEESKHILVPFLSFPSVFSFYTFSLLFAYFYFPLLCSYISLPCMLCFSIAILLSTSHCTSSLWPIIY